MASETVQRPLEFSSLSQVRDDVRQLLKFSYLRLGNWNLSQVCGHLNCWLVYPMDGYPKPGFPVNVMLWLGKITVGKRLLHKVITENKMKPGGITMPATVLEAGFQSDQDAAEELLKNLERFENFKGTIQTSPLFGDMDYDTARKLQLVHCAHHLSFLKPKEK